jgi:N-acetylneuraminic acid mutarotase
MKSGKLLILLAMLALILGVVTATTYATHPGLDIDPQPPTGNTPTEAQQISLDASGATQAGIENVGSSTLANVTPANPPIGTPFDMCFTMFVQSPDAEYMDHLDVDLPDGWTVNSVAPNSVPPANGCAAALPPVVGVGGGNVVYWQSTGYPPQTGCGAWNGSSIGLNFDFCANVTIPDLTGAPWMLPWNYIGDGWGGTPHQVSGSYGPIGPALPITLMPDEILTEGCANQPQVHPFSVVNNAGYDTTVNLSYAILAGGGTCTGPGSVVVPNGGSVSFDVILTPVGVPSDTVVCEITAVDAANPNNVDTSLIIKHLAPWFWDPAGWQLEPIANATPNQWAGGVVGTNPAAAGPVGYVVGGLAAGSSVPNPDLQMYDPGTGTWTQLTDMPNQRFSPVVGWIGGLLYAAGGYDTTFVATNDLQVYNPATNAWDNATPANMPNARGGGAGGVGVCASGSGPCLFHVGGGPDSSFANTTLETWQYDPSTNAWTQLDSKPAGSSPDGHILGAGVGCLGQIYVGGDYRGFHEFYRLDATQPAGSQWTQLASIPATAGAMTPALVCKEEAGVIVLIGGDPDGNWGTYNNTAYVYDIASNTWSGPLPQTLNVGQLGSVAWHMYGKVWTAGGTVGSGAISPMPFESLAQIVCPTEPPPIEWEKYIDGIPWQPGMQITRQTSDTIVVQEVLHLPPMPPKAASDLARDLPVYVPPTVVAAPYDGDSYAGGGYSVPEDPGIDLPPTPKRYTGPDALVYYGDRATFDADHPGLPVEGFENTLVPDFSVLACDGPFDSSTNNACFAPGGILDGIRLMNVDPTLQMVVLGDGFLGNPSALVGPNTFTDNHDLTFYNGNVYAVGLDLWAPLGAATFDVYIYGPGDVLLGQTSVLAATTGTFWGVASDEPITRIRTESAEGAGELFDNIAFGGGAQGPVWAQIETWNPAELHLLDWAAIGGQVIVEPDRLVWTGELLEPATITLTKWFHVEPCTWTETLLWEELWLEQTELEQRPVVITHLLPDLWIDAMGGGDVPPGQVVSFTLLYGNDGGYENEAMIRNDFPPGAEFANAYPYPDRWDPAGLWAEWDLGDLPTGGQGSIEVAVMIAAAAPPSITLEVWDGIFDHTGVLRDWVVIPFHVMQPLIVEWEKYVDGMPWQPGMDITRQTSDTIEVVEVINVVPPPLAGWKPAAPTPPEGGWAVQPALDLVTAESQGAAPVVPGATWSMPEIVLWDNGPLVTHAGACSGMDASRLQTDLLMNTLGFGHQLSVGNRMGDDFSVTDPSGWQIDTITFFAYQTGAPTDPSPITGVYYQIWNGPPDDPGSSVVFGDLTTNRLLSSTFSGIQRDSGTTPCANNRYIFADVASAGVTLPPGTYWIDWMTDGSLASGPWAPPITILGQTTTGNGLQYQSSLPGWVAALDSGTLTQQDMPFIIEGTIIGPPVWAQIETWDPTKLHLVDWAATGGTVVIDPAGQLVWSDELVEPTTMTLTKWFHVEPCTWTETLLWEELWLGQTELEQRPVMIHKLPPALGIDAMGGGPAFAGQVVSFTLLYGNDGGYENNVMIRNDFPPGANFANAFPYPDRWDPGGLWAEWDIGDLPMGAQGGIEVAVFIAPTVPPSTTLEIWDGIFDHTGTLRDWVTILFHVEPPPHRYIYLPLVFRNYASHP